MKHDFENNTRIRIVRRIASGGMGTVNEAIQFGAGGFEKRVAIKEILPLASDDRLFVDMFVSEAKLVANLVHENIVQIYQLNEQGSRYYIVMEYVHGLSLAEFIELHRGAGKRGRDKPIPIELAVFITSRIARGLAYAHNRHDCFGRPLHIVHRDVCPKNILITTEGLPKLGDFGIASADILQLDRTRNRTIGKLMYMAPEQAAAESVDFRADIYSLGLVLMELLSLQRARGKWRDNLMEAATQGWVDWNSLPLGLPRVVRMLLEKMLAERPGDRNQSTDELARELELFIYGRGYGPTVVTLEKYLRDVAPYLYNLDGASVTSVSRPRVQSNQTTVLHPDDRTNPS